jgi:hypothetical protein
MGVRAWPGEIVDYVVADTRATQPASPVLQQVRQEVRFAYRFRRRRADTSDEVPPARIASP